MPDDRTKRGPADRTRINVHEDYELDYWTAHFKCTRAELLAAVKAAGVMASDVEAHLKKSKK